MRQYDHRILREEKQMACRMLFERLCKSTSKLDCIVLMPSLTCLDIDTLKPLLHSETRLICVENFSYINGTRREWEDTVLSHVGDLIDKDGVFFHEGELDSLQLGAVLRRLGAEHVDFAFFDFCGELTMRQYRWIRDNRALFKPSAMVAYTIDLHPSILNECPSFDHRIRLLGDYARGTSLISLGNHKLSARVEDSSRGWSFILKHILCPSYDAKCESFIYSSGGKKHKMMLSLCNVAKNDDDSYRDDYYEGFFKNSSSCDRSLLAYDGVAWGDYGCGKHRKSQYELRSNDVLLFQNKAVDALQFDYGRFFRYLFDGVGTAGKKPNMRRFHPDRIKNCISACSRGNFPPEKYSHMYKSTKLYFAKCDQIYRHLLMDRDFEHDGLVFRFDGMYNILFRNRHGEFVDYLDNFNEALRMSNGGKVVDGECVAMRKLT